MRSQGSQEWQLAYDSSIPSVHGVDWHSPVLVFFRLATHSPLKSSRRHSPQLSGTLVAFLYTALASKPDGTWRELEPTSMRLRDSQERGVVSDSGISVAHGIDWQSPVRVFSRWATHSPRLPQRTIAFLHSALTTHQTERGGSWSLHQILQSRTLFRRHMASHGAHQHTCCRH